MTAHAQIHASTPVLSQSKTDLIEIRGLDKTYANGGVHALSNIDLNIRDGEFVCVVGPSGCGKSTLLRILAGLDDHDTGVLPLTASRSPVLRVTSAWFSRRPICCPG